MTTIQERTFINANGETVPYDGSPITWRVSAYVFIFRKDQVLLIKNKLEKLYDIVGGGVEFGETIEETLQREALEEAGAKIKIGKLIDAHTDWFYHKRGTFHQTIQLFYEAELIDELRTQTESEIEWRDFAPLSEVGKTYFLPTHVQKLIEQFQK